MVVITKVDTFFFCSVYKIVASYHSVNVHVYSEDDGAETLHLVRDERFIYNGQ